jgi:metallo-beta-lactamase class B
MHAFRTFIVLVFCGLSLEAIRSRMVFGQDTSTWHEPFPPHRIADNLYYVGSRGLASYLITTSEGHILINCSFERTVPLIRASIEKFGFKIADVKIILSSHAHGDHVEGTALMQELTGARVFVMQGDDRVLRSGGAEQYLYKDCWKPCRVDRVLKDGDKVNLGGSTLFAHLTPGHTRGCTTWTMTVSDHGKPREVVIIGSPNVNPGYELVNNKTYPNISDDFERTFKVLKSLPCDIFLGAHGNYYDMESKYAKLTAGAENASPANPFVDPEGYRAFVADREKAYRDVLKKQQNR